MDTNTPPTPETLAWAILDEGEATDAVRSMAEDRAACGGLPTPTAVNHYLYWIEDEAEIQEANFETLPEMYAEVPPYITLLRELAGRLRDLGFTPQAPTEEAEEGKNEEGLAPLQFQDKEVGMGFIGKRIVALRPMTHEEASWMFWPTNALPLVFVLEDGSVLFPSSDEEGNGPGTFMVLQDRQLFTLTVA